MSLTAATDQPCMVLYQPTGQSSDISIFGSRRYGQIEEGWTRVIQCLQSLVSLSDDWDGLGATAPSLHVVQTAIAVAQNFRKEGMEIPGRAAATPAGTILFEWHHGSDYMEIEVVSPTLIEWMTMDRNGVSRHGSQIVRDTFRYGYPFCI